MPKGQKRSVYDLYLELREVDKEMAETFYIDHPEIERFERVAQEKVQRKELKEEIDTLVSPVFDSLLNLALERPILFVPSTPDAMGNPKWFDGTFHASKGSQKEPFCYNGEKYSMHCNIYRIKNAVDIAYDAEVKKYEAEYREHGFSL